MDAVECDWDAGEVENIANECVLPIDNCKKGHTMTQGDGSLYCKSCVAGFQTGGAFCEELADPDNCAQVLMANPKQCEVCEEGFDQVEHSKDENCYVVPDNCLKHGTNGCETCEKGWDVTTAGLCSVRDNLEGCEVMSWAGSAADDKCEQCMQGFMLNKQSLCEELDREVDENCDFSPDTNSWDADEWGWCTNCVEG